MTRKFIALAGLLLGAAPAFADDRCPQETQTGLTICFRDLYATADGEMTQAYQQLIAELSNDPAEEENLLKAQRAWITFRDADCHFQGQSARGGTMEPMLINICLLDRTEQRRDQIKATLDEMLSR